MIRVGNTFYIYSDNLYLHCRNGSIEVYNKDTKEKIRHPFEGISDIIIFTDTVMSCDFVYACDAAHISVTCISPTGKTFGKFVGANTGNVVLRKSQFNMLDSEKELMFVQNLIGAKIHNQSWLLKYFANHNQYADCIKDKANSLDGIISKIQYANTVDAVRNLEASAAMVYFSAFDYLIKVENMKFEIRTRRPPLNRCNALLSYFYSIMTSLCTSALMSRGLDSECGYLHRLRSGRDSLACDLVEEFRACIVDRFVITIINRKEIQYDDFEDNESGIRMKTEPRRNILNKWNVFLKNEVRHKLYDEKLALRTLPYEQALFLAQYIRGDIDKYPPFLMT